MSFRACTRIMRKSINNFLEFLVWLQISQNYKTNELLNIDFTIKLAITEGTFYIHLINLEGLMRRKCKKDTNDFKMCNRYKCLIIVNTLNMCESFGNQSSFVSDDYSCVINIVSKNPMRYDNLVIQRRRDKGPYLISYKILFFVISYLRVVRRKSTMKRLWALRR